MLFAERLASTVEAEGIGRSCRVAGMKKLLDGQDFSGQTPPCNVVVLCNAFFDQAISTGDDAWIPRYTDALCDQLLKFVQSLLPATQTGSPVLYDSGSSRAAQSQSKMDQGRLHRDIQSSTIRLARACSGATLGIRQGRCPRRAPAWHYSGGLARLDEQHKSRNRGAHR